MMRALWSAASGMLAQQSNLDVISNNLSNVNTMGYKRVRAEFQDLIYSNMRVPESLGVTEDQMQLPLQVGSGVRMIATRRDFDIGIMEETGKTFDFMLEGQGFFVVQTPQGELYTRTGNFNYSPTGENDEMGIFTTDGYPVLLSEGEDTGEPIVIPGNIQEVKVKPDGTIIGISAEEPLGVELGTVAVAFFANPGGLLDMGRNLYNQSASSGERILMNPNVDGQPQTRVLQGYIEGSNVAAVDELVKMIVAQRAYELNSKAIQSADEMLSQANNLRR